MRRAEWERYRPSTRVVKSYPLYWAARVYVEVVRGCSNYTMPRLEELLPPSLLPDKPQPGCAYCSVVSLWGYARSRSPRLVYEEVKGLIDAGVTRIVLSGPDFLDYGRDWLVEPRPLVNPSKPPANVKALDELLKLVTGIPEVASGEVAVMAENAKPNLVTEESARVLGEYLRGTPIHVGAETGDDRLLSLLGRPARVSDAVRAVRLLRSYGLRPYVYVMYCLPGETRATVSRTLRLMERLYRAGAEKITAYRFTPLPGSALHKLAGVLRCGRSPVKARAEEINARAKRRMIGRVVRVVTVGYSRRFRGVVAYPMPHGPVTVLRPSQGLGEGLVVEARYTGLLSERVMEAYPLRVVKKLRRSA